MIVGSAGHIDHGKTSLVRALTGVDADRLKEEKARGITIDIGFAYMPGADGKVIGFVDVPGHERFVHNMLAGATGIDFALLVVAADDGVMPQTREHLAILDLLGIERGIVALTKADLVEPDRLAAAHNEVANALLGTKLEGIEIIADVLRYRLGRQASFMAGCSKPPCRSTGRRPALSDLLSTAPLPCRARARWSPASCFPGRSPSAIMSSSARRASRRAYAVCTRRT